MRPPTWRTRLQAALTFADHLLLQADTLISACLDIRPLHRSGTEFLRWLGQTWRTHLATAHARRYGPGRGVIAVIITRPTQSTEEDETHG
ncbi:hypothetical protein PWG71_24215 [Nocardiopsis sp. N85]|uniref:hypothetical protein n=1 Tax=Nocardiopsis sp. N85 TaxID=3029400 RepID=UPI00237F7F72|nr:hypothetical protein [Nocardiopsis sp. N85]MDE3724508.1 hypothetical protein [Nocardiopsis sp. N85]